MSISPARVAALRILQRVSEDAAWITSLLQAGERDGLSQEDRALAYEICLGVVRWQALLDFQIERLSGRLIAKLDSPVKVILRMGFYQMAFLDRIPHHAIVNDSVNLVRKSGKSSASGMVNAVLRKASKVNLKSDGISEIKDSVERLAVETSHPKWLLNRWLERFGFEDTRSLALSNNQPPSTCFRFVREKAEEAQAWFSSAGQNLRASEIVPGAWRTTGLSQNSKPVSSGWIYQQDEASQLVALLARNGLTGKQRLLDLCAAPGSKTSMIADGVPPSCLIVASELHSARVATLKKAVSAYPNVVVIQCDAANGMPFASGMPIARDMPIVKDTSGTFDRILVDAPCTGLGTLQRHPEIKWRVKEADIAQLAGLQFRLLEKAASLLKPGGQLIYSVCSTEEEEGEQVAAKLLENSNFTSIGAEACKAAGIPIERLRVAGKGVRTFPHLNACEGFFLAVFSRTV